MPILDGGPCSNNDTVFALRTHTVSLLLLHIPPSNIPLLSHTVQRTRVIESVNGILQLPVHGSPRAVFITHSFHALHSCYNGLASTLILKTTRTYSESRQRFAVLRNVTNAYESRRREVATFLRSQLRIIVAQIVFTGIFSMSLLKLFDTKNVFVRFV